MLISFNIYKHSALATTLKIIGLILALSGLGMIASREVIVAGIIMAVIGAGLMILAEVVSRSKLQKLFIKNIKEKGLEPTMASDINFAVKAYCECPGKKTLKYIKQLNPSAAEKIEMKARKR